MSTHTDLVSLSRAARLLCCDRSTVYRAAIRHGRGVRIDTRLFLLPADLDFLRETVRSGQPGNPNFVAGNELWRLRKTSGKSEKKRR
jgi:hypothetical protein